jgi:ferric-dicitrate binding protein FerR (iron transport regulator)
VVLVSGAVTLAPRERPDVAVLLAPGQQSRVVALDAPTAPASADLGAALGWTGGVFAREDAARTVARRIGERFGVEVSVAPALAGEPVSGEFSGADGAADALGKLALTLGARVERTPGGYRIVEAAR